MYVTYLLTIFIDLLVYSFFFTFALLFLFIMQIYTQSTHALIIGLEGFLRWFGDVSGPSLPCERGDLFGL